MNDNKPVMHMKSESGELYIDPYATHQFHQIKHENGHPPQSAGSSGSAKQSSSSDGGFKCDECPKSFTRKDHLVRHKANHSKDNHYCQICKRAFKRLDLLQRHEKRQICTASDQHRGVKRQRDSSSHSSGDESDSPPPNSTVPQTFANPHLGYPSMYTDAAFMSGMMPMTVNPMSTSSMSDHTQSTLEPTVPPDLLVQEPNDDFHNDLGFGLWPTESWEPVFQISNMHSDWMDPQALLVPPQSSTPRMQESAERGQLNLATAALVVKLERAFPDVSLDLAFVTESLNLYWTQIAPTFPFIHRGTFEFATANEELVLMMIIVGAMKTAKARDFSAVVSRIRGVLVQNCGLDMPISRLQCFTLCHIYDTWFGTFDTLFTAQCMWPVMVAHSRKRGIGVVGGMDPELPEEEATWAIWAQAEQSRRAVYCILLMDTQLGAFWHQHVSRQLSILAHHVALPCPRAEWDAITASDWLRIRANGRRQTSSNLNHGPLPGLRPQFTVGHVAEGYASAVLEAFTIKEPTYKFTIDLDNFLTCEMVLMGLMAIAWDCRTRGGMGLKTATGEHWRVVVMRDIICLRSVWEGAVSQTNPTTIEVKDIRDSFALCIISVLSDIPMLQASAGAVQICGTPIGPKQAKDCKRRMHIWAKTEDAWTSLWQSARYLRSALYCDWGLYSPWAVYVTTLVAWACITSQTECQPQATEKGTDAGLAFLTTILESRERVDPVDGLGDLIMMSARALCQDRSVGGAMQRELGESLFRLVVPANNHIGESVSSGSSTIF